MCKYHGRWNIFKNSCIKLLWGLIAKIWVRVCTPLRIRLPRPCMLQLHHFSYFFSLANTTDSLSASGLGSHRNWLQGLDSPLIQPTGNEESGQKELKLRFDVSQYSPEEIVVKTVDNKLLVNFFSNFFYLFCIAVYLTIFDHKDKSQDYIS